MTKPLRALLLAAGFGTRLRPLTENTPKCLVPINGEPLLARWLDQLELLGCRAALVNTHYLAEQVQVFAKSWKGRQLRLDIVHESVLLGTAATLLTNREYFTDATGILIHADNVTTADLSGLIDAHQNRPTNCLLTMLTFTTSTPSSCGIVETDPNGVVTSFYEKVQKPPTNKANGAIYLFDAPFLDWLQTLDPHVIDFSTHVIPKLMGRIQSWHTNDFFIDIGTPQSLVKAQQIISYDN